MTDKLRLLWSPEQIAGWLKQAYPHDESCRVSHETIYRSLIIQARGALKKELLQHLRRTRGMRRSRHHTQKTGNHGQIVGAVSISERPASVEDRAVPGHWEGDLVFGDCNSQIATLVERQTRYLMFVKLAAKDTETVVDALIKNTRKLPQELYKSLTWDRDKEMAAHKRFTLATDIQVYFCDPPQPLAARQQREHERSAQAVPAQRHRHLELLTSQTQCRRETIERETEKDARLPDAG